MGTDNTAGYLSVREESEAESAYTRFSKLVLPDGSLTGKLDGADELHLDITGATWVELAVSAYADIATAVSTIGATPATLVIDSPETVSTALTIPSTLFLRIAKGASLTKSGSGTITFQGLGIEDAKSQLPLFFGFAVGDITWTGTVYPKEVSLELWDTANTSLSDRLERACAAFNNGSKAVKFIAYPRVITKSVELFDWQSIHFTPGEYTNTATGHPATFPQFLLNDHCGMTADTGAIIYESNSPTNAHIIAAKMMYVAGADGTVEDIQIRDLYIKGHPSQTHNGVSSTIILGNAKNSSVRNVTLHGTHAYGVLVGGFSTAGNYAENVDVTDFRSIDVGTQILAMINGKDVTFRNIHIDVRNHNATGTFACVDIEPNTTDNRCENITVENVFIDARTTIAGFFINGVTMQAANAPVLINPVVRNVTFIGKDVSTSGAFAGQATNAVVVYGAIGGVVENVFSQGTTQEAVFAQNCRYTRFRNIDILQNNSASGAAVKFEGCSEMRVDTILIDETYTPFTQLTNIVESESTYRVTSSASTITETNPGGNPRFYSHLVGLTVTLNNTDYVIDTTNPITYSLTTTVAVGTLTAKTFTDGSVTVGTENIAITAHGHNTGSRVWLSTTGAVPAGLTANRIYFVIRVDADNLKLADTLALALAGTPVDITAAAGGGTHTLTPVLITKFSSNQYRGNKAAEGITLEPTGTSVVYNRWDEKLTDFVNPAHSIALGSLTSIPKDNLLGCLTEVVVDPITLRSTTGISVTGADNRQTKILAGSSWDSGAFSYESLLADGVLETTVIETNKDRMIGLAYADTGIHYDQIDYACYLSAGGALQGYNLGTGSGATPGYSASDVITLTRVGSEIRLAINGAAAFKTFTGVAAGPMYVKTAFGSSGATLGGIVLRGTGDIEVLTASQVSGLLSGYVETKLSTVAGVDLNTATATTLYTCPTGKSCVVTKVVIRNASTSLTTVSFSVGWNSATFNNVIADATHVELTGNTLYTSLPAKIGATVGTSTGILKTLNNTLQGAAATATMEVWGYLF